MTTLIEAARQALEALEAHADLGIKSDKAITALRTAIEQAEKQEPTHIVQSNGRHSPLLTHMMNSRTTPPAAQPAPVQEPVAWDVFELRLYGAPQENQHRVLWVDRYTHPDGSTPDLDGLLEAATKDGGIDGGAKTLYVRPLYTTPPAAQPAERKAGCTLCGYCAATGERVVKADTRSELVDNDFEENT